MFMKIAQIGLSCVLVLLPLPSTAQTTPNDSVVGESAVDKVLTFVDSAAIM